MGNPSTQQINDSIMILRTARSARVKFGPSMVFHWVLFVQYALPFHVTSGFQPSSQYFVPFLRVTKSLNARPAIFRLSSSNRGNDHEDLEKKGIDNKEESKEEDEKMNNFFPSFLSRFTRGVTRGAETSAEVDAVPNRASENGAAATLVLSEATSGSSSSSIDSSLKRDASLQSPIPPSAGGQPLSQLERAQQLRAQANKARLEAERMDAELTLQKIANLERKLAHAKVKGSESVEDLQKQMTALQGHLTGGKNSTASSAQVKQQSSEKQTTKASSNGTFTSSLSSLTEPFDQKEFDKVFGLFDESPSLFKKLVSAQLGLTNSGDGNVNTTEVALRLDEIRRFDFSFSNEERPKFSQDEIDTMKQRLKADWFNGDPYIPDGRIKNAAGGNDTELALLCLEFEYFNDKYLVNEQRMTSLLGDREVVAEISSALVQGSYNGLAEGLFPPCTRKEGQQPTLLQAEKVVKEILPKTKFTSTSKPIEILGGYVVKGDSKAKDGDALIKSIDEQLEKTSLRGKVTVCYLNDFIPQMSENIEGMDFDFIIESAPLDFEERGLIFIGGPDLAREPRPLLLSITSAIGLATCWYLSLYPFLLNPTLAKRVDEQLALVEASMPADLSWLTDLSFPLFATFVGLQLFHEAGHRIAAVFTDVRSTVPTFVPSIITGVTSVATSLKAPAKNLQALFDFSIAGPLFGMIASMVAIFAGTQLSVAADPTNFPALPLEILLQSSLGGGIIEGVLGSGVLNVPDAARGSQAVAEMTIRLHPVAVAGYISLLVNALCMLPIGTTDGGRVAMVLFGRQSKMAIGGLAFFVLVILGFQGSDLLLFYVAFCLAFHKGNEIPCRNEVDKVDFSRVLVATGTYFLALLALIPIP